MAELPVKFEIGPGVECNPDILVDTRMLIQCNSGGGKSWCLRRLLEQTHGSVQHLIIDPEGEFASLRERYDYVLAAKHDGDTAADPRVAKLLAHRLLELNASAILDIYELKAHERIAFVKAFLEALVDAPKKLWHPAIVVLDEAHVFAPQQGSADSLGAVIDLATRGRKRGFCAVLATQRLSKLHKDAAAECNNKLIGRTGLDVDRKRAGDELGFREKADELALRDLAPGEFYAFGPAFPSGISRVMVGPVQTTHPKAGGRIAFEPPPPTAAIKAMLPQLADLPAEAEEKRKTEEDLKRDNANLRRQLTIAEKAQPAASPPSEELIARRVDAALAQRDREHAQHEKMLAGLVSHTEKQLRSFRGSFDGVEGAIARLQEAMHTNGTAPTGADRAVAIPPPVIRRESAASERAASPVRSAAPVAVVPGEGLTGPQQRVLDALSWWEEAGVSAPSKISLGFIAGYRVSKKVGGTFGNILGELRSSGLIQYPSAGSAALTDEGRALARIGQIVPTRDGLHDAIHERLDGPESRVLQVLIEHYPDALSKQECGELAGYQVGPKVGGTYGNIIGRLRSLGLAEYPTAGQIAATALLFPEELS